MNTIPTISAHTARELEALPPSEHASYFRQMLAVAAAGLLSTQKHSAAVEDVYRVVDAMTKDHAHG